MQPVRFIVFITMFIFGSSQVHAEKMSELRVTASPWSPYVSRDLPDNGVAVNIVRSALKRAGYRSSFALESWPADLEKTRLGVYDVIASIWFTEDRATDLVFSDAIIENRIMLMVRADSDIPLSNPGNLEGYRVGVVEDYAYVQKTYSKIKNALIKTATVEESLQSLISGDIDIAVADEHVAIYTLNSKIPGGIRKVRFSITPLSTRQLKVAVSRQRSDAEKIVTDFNQALQGMKEDGTYQGILHQYRLNP